MGSLRETSGGRRHWTTLVLACVLALGSVLSASPARADAPGETTEGYLLVQQALGHLAHDTTANGIEAAMEKVNDALKTKDQQGVAVAEVEQAKTALEAGQVEQGRALLQKSITEAISQFKPAIGEETGTTVVPSALPGRGAFGSVEWGFLVVSVLLLLLGAGVAWRFRPQENVRELRRRLDPKAPVQTAAQPGAHAEDAS